MEKNQNQCSFKFIGIVNNKINLESKMPVLGVKSKILIKNEYQEGLLGLDGYSHIIVIGLLHQLYGEQEKELLIRSKDQSVFPDQGIFALRGRRINPVSFNVCKLINMTNDSVIVDNLDLITNTPILDLKPYIPYYDSVETAKIPNWAR